jgi:hypothetical protein
MKTRVTILFVLLCALSVSAAVAAQTSQATAKAPVQGADFTGVWYPPTGSTLEAATPDDPGQQFVWRDPQGKPMKKLPFTPWGTRNSSPIDPTHPE